MGQSLFHKPCIQKVSINRVVNQIDIVVDSCSMQSTIVLLDHRFDFQSFPRVCLTKDGLGRSIAGALNCRGAI